MSIQYSGSSISNTLWTASSGTKQELIDQIETELNAAGWTTISGSGTTTLVLESAATPDGLQMRLRVKGTNTNCVSISIENVSGSKTGGNSTTAGAMLLPAASKQWQFVAGKYQAFIWMTGSTTARGFVGFGVPALPSFLSGVVTEAIWIQGNASSDTDATVRDSFRTRLSYAPGNTLSNQQAICNGNVWDHANASINQNGGGFIAIPALQIYLNAVEAYRYHDDSAFLLDPLMSWGLTTATDPSKIRGQLWDAVATTGAYNGDLTTTFDGHNWITLTNGNTGSSTAQRGGLILATS